MALKATNLTIQMGALPATFRGNPQDLAVAMLARMKILSPDGSSFIFTGDTKPTSNVGPWLKGGTQWYVWDSTINDYVPLDVSPSITAPYWFQAGLPSGTNPPLWFKTEKDPSDVDPTYGKVLYVASWDGTAWNAFIAANGLGTTAERPAAPGEGTMFYDTTINVQLWFERGQWRTYSGVPGDIKAVIFSTLQDALDHNPGWILLGTTAPQFYGRTISQATKDAGATPVDSVTPGDGVNPRAAGEIYGTDLGYVDDPADTQTLPAGVALWHLLKQ